MSLPFKKLSDDKVILHKRRETFKKQMKQMTTQYEALKAQLNDNETYTQVKYCATAIVRRRMSCKQFTTYTSLLY